MCSLRRWDFVIHLCQHDRRPPGYKRIRNPVADFVLHLFAFRLALRQIYLALHYSPTPSDKLKM